MSDCPICVEKYNNSSRKLIQCSYCEYNSCMTCTQTYILSHTGDAQCMNCNKVWSKEFVSKTFSKTFRTTSYKKHREKILFDNERGLLPATQLIIENVKSLNQEISDLTIARATIKKNIQDLQLELDQTEEVLHRARYYRDIYLSGQVPDGDQLQQVKTRSTFIKPCPNCNGFLSTQWTCGLCNTKVCSKCFEIKPNENEETKEDEETKDAEHVCQEDNLKSAEEIRKTCKNCPKCGFMTYKIDGCDQIWCVHCHTAWSFRTGKIETGTIHNPHYYEYMRRNNNGVIPRNPGDNPCGERANGTLPPLNVRVATPERNILYNIIQRLNHYRIVERRTYRPNNQRDKNIDLRMQFLKNEIAEEKFKILLQRREKKEEKKAEIYMIIDMFCMVGADILWNFYDHHITITQVVNQIQALRVEVNENLTSIEKRYNCIVPYVNSFE